MTLTLDAARAIVRQPGLHLSSRVDHAIATMKSRGNWMDVTEATELERAISREGRPVRHDEMRDFAADPAPALHMPSALAWGLMAIGVFVAWAYALPMVLHGLRAIARFVWGL